MTDNTISNTGIFNTYIPRPGDRIGDNTIIAPLAEGGMARIYKVKNEALEVIRVVKLMKPVSNFDEDRFVTEARISANLNHPNIIQCYRFDKYKRVIPYIEMEYVDGINLHRLISTHGRLPTPVVISIVYFIGKALHALHSCSYTLYDVKRSGIVHRDIKPSNIIIAMDGNVKLADFGIAKPVDLSIHTSEVEVVGSVYYLSPEQLRKDELDFRTDIYSLGCVAYEMITAIKAFDHTNIPDIAQAKIKNQYSKKLLDNCPLRLRRVIVKCLNPNKKDRYDSIEKMSAEIEELLKDLLIDNPQEVIKNYIRDPKKFIPPHHMPEKRRRQPKAGIFVTIIMVLGIIGLFGVIFLFKEQTYYKRDISAITTGRAKPQEESAGTSPKTVNTPGNIKKSKTLQSTQVPQKPTPLPPEEKTEPEPLLTDEDFLETAYVAFRQNDYDKCIRLLSDKGNLNDRLFLCYLGSLAEMKKFPHLSNLINTRSVNDGYYHYIKGRIAYNNKEFDSANGHFLKALTNNSFYKELSYFSNYYLAKSKTAKYMKTPSIVNKNIMVKSFERFVANYCDDLSSAECSDITDLLEKHK
ncbi:serine/threonine protein kinase [Fibrobacterota bacterium]